LSPANFNNTLLTVPDEGHWEDNSEETQATPSSFQLRRASDSWKNTRSACVFNNEILINTRDGCVEFRMPDGKRTKIYMAITLEHPAISVCTDGEYGYSISEDNYIRKFQLSNGKTIGKWPVPANSPYHHQMAVINGKIYYCNVNNNEIIILSTCKESGTKESVMSLGMLEKPCYITDNTEHQEETVIISGASGVGKFPIKIGFSQREWLTRIEHARGVCVDGRGLVYVAKCQPSIMFLLSQNTGK